MLTFLVLACAAEPPSLGGVDPSSGSVGDAVAITGDHFVDGVTVRLGGAELDAARVVGPTRIEGKVPTGAAVGAVDLVVSSPSGKASTLHNAFEVRPEVVPVPCDDAVRIVSQIPPTADVVKIDRQIGGSGKDMKVQQTRIPTADVTAIEYEAVKMEDGTICTAIYIKTRDDRRTLFDSDKKVDLRQQAQKIGNGLHKPVEVTRDERPEEGAAPLGG